jgi:outer membrane protein with beta-barrel domain
MKTAILAAAACACAVLPAQAQTEGRVSVGATVTFAKPSDTEVESTVTIAPLVRLNPRKGWGIAAGLSWLNADLKNPSGAGGAFARLRVRPLMAGVAYSIQRGPLMTSLSVVAGPSFNHVEFDDDFPSAGASIDVENSIAVRPGVGLTWTVAPRVAIVGFGGYVVNRPDTTYRNSAGVELRNRWRADAALLSAGVVYSLF